MFTKKEIQFRVEGVLGELKLAYNLLGTPKLYQDGNQLKKQGIFRMKYQVKTDSGLESLELQRGLSFAYSAIFRNQKRILEEKLTPLEYILGIFPIFLIFIGGALGGFLGAVAVSLIYSFMQYDKRKGAQVVFSLGVTALAYILYFVIVFFILHTTNSI